MHAQHYRSYWGKARPVEGARADWHPFAYHSLDVAAIAAALWNGSAAIRRLLCTAFGIKDAKGRSELQAWVMFFVALHDIGKLHALFQVLAPEVLAESWPALDAKLVAPQPDHYRHGVDGFVEVQGEITDWTGAESRRAREAFKVWLGAVMGHHGELPIDADGNPRGIGKLRPRYAHKDIITHDLEARRHWIEAAAEIFLAPADIGLASRPPKPNDAAHRLLAGFCSLCDWVGSNTDYFPYAAPDTPPRAYFEDQLERVQRERILSRAGLVAGATPCGGVAALLRPNEEPRGVQVLVERLPTTATLTIVEAPTGSGKTEAALAHAWRLVETGDADAIIFALPTQATANAMLTRARAFAERAFAGANVVLAHGHRALNREFQQLIDAGRRATAQGRVEASTQCASWLASSRKRVFLGQVGVCTVDQVLLSVLPIRHSFVRALGIGRAVLIIDEVHAYDAYMNGLLTEVLRRHRAAGGSAILLSATLPASIRNALVGSWNGDPCEQAPYPVLWHASDAGTKPEPLPDRYKPPRHDVRIDTINAPDAFPARNLIEEIVAAADSGALVGIVCNLVQDAQRLAQAIRATTDQPVDLFHARFRLCDRQRIEEAVIRNYGRDAERRYGRILVATQVIEQSLDLDFDWLITQLCPVDLLFQRMGRLHRHPRPSRPKDFEHPRCTVVAVPDGDYGLHELIYGNARLLWRTEQLLAQTDSVRFPDAYRDWIERVYAEAAWDDEPDDILGKHLAWREDQRAAQRTAQQCTSMTITELRDEDETATSLTRDGEMSLTVLPLLEGDRLLDGTPLDSLDEYERLEALTLNAVPVPSGWRDRLAGAEYDEDGRLKVVLELLAGGRWATPDGSLEYSIEAGLERLYRDESRQSPTPAGAGN